MLSVFGVSKVTILFAIAVSIVFLLRTTGGGFGSPLGGGFPTTIVNVCEVERLPPSVAVTVNV